MNSLLFQPSLMQDSVFHQVYSMSSFEKYYFFWYHSKHRSSQSYALEQKSFGEENTTKKRENQVSQHFGQCVTNPYVNLWIRYPLRKEKC